MNKDEMHCLGKITKLHGYKGELTVFLETAKLANYSQIQFLFLELNGNLIPYKIELFEPKTKNAAKVKLQGVNSEADAKALIKALVYIPENQLQSADALKKDMDTWIGFGVEDEEYGYLGEITHVGGLSTNPQIEILHESGVTIFIPLQPEFILGVDPEQAMVHVEAPEGLIDLYLS
ncbi:MAG: ribosome maturation factor RimM [Bacteroidota bacterium]|jgi:16S rRNA processing protein RimM